MRKTVLAFDIDQTLNVAKTPITAEIADLLIKCLDFYEVCPISGQKFDQFLVQIVNPMLKQGVVPAQLAHLHLFVAQGTQYYRYNNATTKKLNLGVVSVETKNEHPFAKYDEKKWEQVYNFPLTEAEVTKISGALETAAKELSYWEEDKLASGDEIIENRLSQVTFSALGQRAGTEEKYAWDPDCKKREKIVARAKKLAPEFDFEIGGTTSINAIKPGMNKEFGMKKLLKELDVKKSEILYFGDMTQPGGNDYPVVKMGIDTITVRSHEDTAYALRGILAVSEED